MGSRLPRRLAAGNDREGLQGSLLLTDKEGCNHELTHSKQPQVLLLQEALLDYIWEKYSSGKRKKCVLQAYEGAQLNLS